MFLAIEIGGSKLQLCVGTGAGEIVERRRFAVNRAAGAVGIRSQILSALPELQEHHSLTGIGVGYGGPVDWRAGHVIKSHQIEGWDGFPLGPWLTSQTGLPAFLENDSNAAAFGEATLGAGRGFSPVFYTNLGSGVGGGLIVDGELYHAAPPGEVEFGHVRLDREGSIVEDRCSGWAVDRRIRAAIEKNASGVLSHLLAHSPGQPESIFLAEAHASGDEIARQIIDEVADDLAYALSHVVHLLHPAVVVIGGGLSLAGECLRSAVATALPPHLMAAFLPGPGIVLAALGEDAVPAGILALAARRHRELLN